MILPLQARQPSCGDQEHASGNDAFLIFRIADKLGIVWDGIATHASVNGQIGWRGAGTDIVGPDYSKISKADIDEIPGAFLRLELKNSFLKTCAGLVRRHSGGATRSFMRDIGERSVPEFSSTEFLRSRHSRTVP